MKDDTKAARRRQQIRTFRCAFGARRPAALSEVLSVAQIEDLLASSVGPYRQRIYSPLVTLELFVHQVLGRDKACQDAVGRRRAERIRWGQAPCSLSSGPYCKARQRLPLALIERSLLQVGQRLEARMPSAWLGQVLPRALSFSMARRLAGLLHEQLLHARKRDITSLIGLTLAGMASCQLPHRPGRGEPHAKKRRPRPLPLLMEPRPIGHGPLRSCWRIWVLSDMPSIWNGSTHQGSFVSRRHRSPEFPSNRPQGRYKSRHRRRIRQIGASHDPNLRQNPVGLKTQDAEQVEVCIVPCHT
jgi:hypothetical protein